MSAVRAPFLRRVAQIEPPAPAFNRLIQGLTLGGDERIEIDPISGTNKYGLPATQRPEDVWLCSSTANPLSGRGLEAVMNAFQKFEETDEALQGRAAAELSTAVRRQIAEVLGVCDCKAVLAASGTDAELLALAIAKSLLPGPITSIVIAPEETGSSVPKAALGCHFGQRANSGAQVSTGQRVAGWETADIRVITVPIRDLSGSALPQSEVDDLVVAHVTRELASGRSILLHVLDRSKTGLQAPSRAAARQIARDGRGRVVVLVDSCQLRCERAEVASDVADGFISMVSGSKFAGGFPFSGALLIPMAMVERLVTCLGVPPGLSAYSAVADWPTELFERVQPVLPRKVNSGLALRWISALAELATFCLGFGRPRRGRRRVCTYGRCRRSQVRRIRSRRCRDADRCFPMQYCQIIPDERKERPVSESVRGAQPARCPAIATG